jgi:hypothetical protein
MVPLAAIVDQPLVLPRPAGLPHCAINKAPALLKWGSFSVDNLAVLSQLWKCQPWLLQVGESVTEGGKNVVYPQVEELHKLTSWSPKKFLQVHIPTGVCHSLEHQQEHFQA